MARSSNRPIGPTRDRRWCPPPERQTWFKYRAEGTTDARAGGKPIADGWVLFYGGDGDEYILGAWDSPEEAVAVAPQFLERWSARG